MDHLRRRCSPVLVSRGCLCSGAVGNAESSAGIAVPGRLGEIPRQWLTSALREAGTLTAGRAASVEVAQIAEGVGLMSQIGRLTIKWTPDAAPLLPATLVVKLPASSESNRRMAQEYGLFARETR